MTSNASHLPTRPMPVMRLAKLTPMELHRYAQRMAMQGKSAMKGVA